MKQITFLIQLTILLFFLLVKFWQAKKRKKAGVKGTKGFI
jgi:hypothetical protein